MNVVILLVVSAAVFILWEKNRNKEETTNRDETTDFLPPKTFSNDEIRIENVRPGGTMTLREVGEFGRDLDLVITAKHAYQKGQDISWELVADQGGADNFIEFDRLGKVRISTKSVDFEELGLEMIELNHFDQDQAGQVDYNGKEYFFVQSEQALFFRDESEKRPEQFDFMEFSTNDGKYFLRVERWSGGLLKVILSEKVEPDQIDIQTLSE